MALDLGAVKGAIELKDSFSEVVMSAAGGMEEFEHKLEGMGGPIAEFAGKFEGSWAKIGLGIGLVATAAVAAIAEITHITMELGERGSTIIEVGESLNHFAGSAANAAAIMEQMRAGSKGLINDLDLQKTAVHLLSAGVKLSADDLGKMSAAALELQQRGLGPAKDMLDSIGDAMVTGRTRSIAMKLGVVDVKDAEADFAEKLGTSADKLSMTGKAEAHRVAVLGMLNAAVTDAGEKQLTFGEKVAQGETAMRNWVDQLAKAVAESPALGIVADTVGSAINDMFGGDQKSAIEGITGFIDGFILTMVDVGIGATEAARVFHVAWSIIQTAVLEAEAVIGTFVQVLGHSIEGVLSFAASLPGAGEGLKIAAAAAHGFNESVDEVTNGLKAERDAALAGVTGHSEFDKTLDRVGGTLMNMRDRMIEAKSAHEDETKAAHEGSDAAREGADANEGATNSFLDKAAAAKTAAEEEKKLAEIEKKSIQESNQLWIQHDKLVADESATPLQAQRNAIDAWLKDEIIKLDKSDRNWQNHYDALVAVANDKMGAVGQAWSRAKGESKEALQEQLKDELDAYEKMRTGGLHFSQEVLDEHIKKIQEIRDKLNGMGKSGKDAFNAMTEAANNNTTAMIKAAEAADKARAANRAMGGAFEVTRENFAQAASAKGEDSGRVETYLKRGFSFEQALLWSKHPEWPPPEHPGPRVQGFAEGGMVDIRTGEHGPEVVRVPIGSTVMPNGRDFPRAGHTVNVEFNIHGTSEEIVRRVKSDILQIARMGRLLGNS